MFITEYTDKIEYMNFIESMIEEQQEMEQYVNECIILSNPNKKIFNEFVAINEAKSGDKVKSFFNRLKSFFAKIWQKFLEKLNAWSQDNKKYLENYKDIILGKEVTLESVKMHDHFKGKQRIDRVINNVTRFAIPLKNDDYDEIHSKTKTSVDSSSDETTSNNYNSYLTAQYNKVFKDADIDNISIKDDDDLNAISSTLTTYFNGDEEQETYYKQDLQDKIKIMFNSVYVFKETFDGLNKIQETYKASMDKSEKAYDAAFSKISTMIKNKENAKDATEKKEIDKKISDQQGEYKKELEKATQEVEKSNQATKENYDFLNEVEVNKSTDSSGTKSEPATIKPGGNKIDTKPSQNAANSTSTNFKNKTSDVKSNAGSNVNTANAKVQGATGAKGAGIVGDDENKIDTKKLDEFQSTAMSLIRAFSTSRTTVFGAMLNGLTSMRNDYMTVIRAHVQSYLGQVNDSSKNTSTTSSNPNTN